MTGICRPPVWLSHVRYRAGMPRQARGAIIGLSINARCGSTRRCLLKASRRIGPEQQSRITVSWRAGRRLISAVRSSLAAYPLKGSCVPRVARAASRHVSDWWKALRTAPCAQRGKLMQTPRFCRNGPSRIRSRIDASSSARDFRHIHVYRCGTWHDTRVFETGTNVVARGTGTVIRRSF